MNQNIVMLNSASIKQLSRQALSGVWGIACIAVLITNILSDVPSIIVQSVTQNNIALFILQMYLIVIGAAMTLGLSMFFLNLFRGMTDIRDLRFGLDYLGKGLTLYAIYTLRVMLYSLLFIIPGIYASYKYGLCFYIFADDPSKNPMQCMYESGVMMDGNKMSMFKLDLSFLPLMILCGIPSYVAELYHLTGGLQMTPEVSSDLFVSIASGSFQGHIATVLSVLLIFVSVYRNTAQTCFYDLAAGNLIVTQQE